MRFELNDLGHVKKVEYLRFELICQAVADTVAFMSA